jgi:hypothetical protein
VAAFIRESHALVGELYLSRKTDPDITPIDITPNTNGGIGSEPHVFAQYLYSRMNVLSAIDPDGGTMTGANYNFCSTSRDYFVMPGGTIVRNICMVTAGAGPLPRLEVTFDVPLNNTVKETFVAALLETADRYTTLYGVTNVNGDCRMADRVLNVTTVCP